MAFVGYLRQSTAVDIPLGPFVDYADGYTAKSGLTISQSDVRLKKGAAAWAAVNESTSASHEENGYYEKALDATDTNTVGPLRIAVSEALTLPICQDYFVLEEAVYDALFAASATGALPVASGGITTASFAAGAINAAAIAADAIGASELAADAVAEIADAVWDEATSGHVTAGTFGQREYAIRANTAQAGAATTITLDASASATDDFYNNDLLFITGGTGAGQARFISDYVGSTKVATVSTWVTNPSSDSVFCIIPFGVLPGAPTANEIADAVLSRNVSNVEGTMPEHCLGTVVLGTLEFSISGTTWTILRTNGVTTHATKTLAVDPNADPIVGSA
jgi:hypothetical protein